MHEHLASSVLQGEPGGRERKYSNGVNGEFNQGIGSHMSELRCGRENKQCGQTRETKSIRGNAKSKHVFNGQVMTGCDRQTPRAEILCTQTMIVHVCIMK